MLPERYTESQVLCGLREAWENITGVDDPFDDDTQIDTFMKADETWDEIDFADIFRGLERFFEFECSNDEWKDFFGVEIAKRSLDEWDRTVAPRLTFRALANFIAERAPVIASFAPITVLGRNCAPAGVFNGVQRLVVVPRIAPSTRIIDVLRGHTLDNFWMRLRWMTEHSIPPLPDSWRSITGMAGCVGVMALLIGVTASWFTSNLAYTIPAVAIAILLYIAASMYKQQTNPLPPDIVTFRDLATHIVQSRE